ncbi:protease complex subunit PrcB family protein [Methanococcus maripaludis]|nr:protease complex subunit PrcB family protein [Methanococcus maripaludis]
MKYSFIFLISAVLIFSGCIENNITTESNETLFLNNTSSKNPNIGVELNNGTESDDSSEIESISFKILEFGIYGDSYKHYESSIIGDKTIIEVYMGKKLGSDNIIEINLIKLKNGVLIVYIEEITPETISDRAIVYPYEIVEVNGIYNNVEFKTIE